MTMILMALIVFVAILVLGYPIINADQYEYETMQNGDERGDNLTSQYNSIFDALRDLEFDHNTGKLSDHDYKEMRARYDVKAAEVLQKMDALTASQAKRANGKKAGASGAGKTACPKCNAKVLTNDRFCPVCGTRLV